MQPTDLEAIVMLLELGAITLTPHADAPFTYEQLFAEAQRYGGAEFALDERDVKIVMPFMGEILKRLPGGFLCLA